MATKDKDYRLVTLIVDVCPLPCRKLFENLAQSDPIPGVPYSLDNYMAFRKHDVKKLMKLPPKSIRRDQFALIYPTASINKWDVSLLSSLLFGLFESQMQNGEDHLIKIIRDIRNRLQHKPGSDVLEDSEFDTLWNDIETSTLTLAQIIGKRVYENEMKKLVKDARINNLPRLGDTLKVWYEDIITQLRNDIEALSVTPQESLDILKQTTVQRTTSTGGKAKRQKIDDPILKTLRGQFDMTLHAALPDDFNPSPEDVSNIRSKLRDNHFVVVSGYENTSYLATALSAIKASDYYTTRCMEMKTLDDWRHIDPEETDLVLFCEPLPGNVASISKKTNKQLMDTFRSMLQSASVPEKKSRIDVVIVSEHKLIEDWKELFDDIVVLYKPTEETNPLDLVKGHNTSGKRRSTDDVLGNMLAYSEAYIEQWRTASAEPEFLESAKKKFQRHKAIVITGPKGSGKTNFAVNLVSSCYEKNQCVVLTDASEWKHVTLGEVSVIIIDEFAGKFKYNATLAEGWLSKFDLIYAAVTQGKLNVIVTCETTRFSKMLKNFPGHALLDNRVKLTGRALATIVKTEPKSPASEEESVSNKAPAVHNTMNADENDEHVNLYTRNDNRVVSKQKEPELLFESGPMHTVALGTDQIVSALCELPDGTLVVSFCEHRPEMAEEAYSIAKLDVNDYTIKQSVDLTSEANSISFIGGQEIVVFMRQSNQMQHATVEVSNIDLQDIKSIPVNYDWLKLIRIKGGKYIMGTKTAVFIYAQNWKEIRLATDIYSEQLFFEGWPSNENKVSKKKNITDIAVGEDKFYVSSDEKIVVLNFDGEVIRQFKTEGKSVSLYSEKFLLVHSKSTISMYSVEGKLLRVPIEMRSRARFIFYGKKNEKLFLYCPYNDTIQVCDIGT